MSTRYLDGLIEEPKEPLQKFISENNDVDGNEVFTIEPVQLQFSLVNLISLKANNNILVLALKNSLIYRINLNRPEFVDKIDLFNTNGNGTQTANSNKIKDLYLDPTGNHLIISTIKNTNYYLNKASSTPILLSKLKNLNISYIHFHNNDRSTNEIYLKNFLIGSNNGQIFESSIEFKPTSNKIVNNFLKLVWKNPINNNSNSQMPIDGIFFKIIKDNNSNENNEEEIGTLHTVIIQSDDIFYYKTEDFLLNFKRNHPLFINAKSGSSIFSINYTDYEKLDDLGSISSGNKFISNGDDFAWITSSGIIFTDLNKPNDNDGKLLTQLNYLLNIQLPEVNPGNIDANSNTHAVVLTKYHIIYLRNNNELIIINKINQETILHKYLPSLLPNEKFLGLSADYGENTFWIYSNFNIYEIVINNESKDIWKIYLKNNQFDTALSLVESTNTNKQATIFVKDLILSKKSEYLLETKEDYDKAAETYAYTSHPFESVALELIKLNQFDSLLKYLTIKLQLLPPNNDDDEVLEKDEYYIQKTLLGSWIIELYMKRFNDLSQEDVKKSASLKNNFEKFLTNYKQILNREIVYQIFKNHNSQEYLLFYGNLIEDYDFILNYWINLENWDQSLKILEKINNPKLIYKYSNILLLNSTDETLKLWIKLYKSLNYKKFIPAILSYNRNFNNNLKISIENNLILNYLKFLIFEVNAIDTIVHNIYLSILVMYPNNNVEAENYILKYLERYNKITNNNNDGFGSSDDFDNKIYFDVDFILRLFLKFEKFKPAIYVYSIIQEYENAIELSLKYNYLNLACLIADRSFEEEQNNNDQYSEINHNNNTIRKKLWLKIADKMIKKLIVEKFYKVNKDKIEIIESLEDSNENNIANIINNDSKYQKILQNSSNDKKLLDLINNDDEEIQKLLEFLLSKCELISIKDLLPLFPNFQSINNFKMEIIKNLETYGLKINQLNNLINQSIKFNNNLVEDLKKLQLSRYYYLINVETSANEIIGDAINNNASCKSCQGSIFTKKFIIFGCQHAYHIDCLINYVLNSSNKKHYKMKKQLLLVLQKSQIRLTNNNNSLIPNENKNNKVVINKNAIISKELEEIVCAKCVLCSDINIDSIDDGFLNNNSLVDRKLEKEWEL